MADHQRGTKRQRLSTHNKQEEKRERTASPTRHYVMEQTDERSRCGPSYYTRSKLVELMEMVKEDAEGGVSELSTIYLVQANTKAVRLWTTDCGSAMYSCKSEETIDTAPWKLAPILPELTYALYMCGMCEWTQAERGPCARCDSKTRNLLDGEESDSSESEVE